MKYHEISWNIKSIQKSYNSSQDLSEAWRLLLGRALQQGSLPGGWELSRWIRSARFDLFSTWPVIPVIAFGNPQVLMQCGSSRVVLSHLTSSHYVSPKDKLGKRTVHWCKVLPVVGWRRFIWCNPQAGSRNWTQEVPQLKLRVTGTVNLIFSRSTRPGQNEEDPRAKVQDTRRHCVLLPSFFFMLSRHVLLWCGYCNQKLAL